MNFSPFIYAFEQTNIAITGEGTLDGQANNEYWWPWNGRPQYGWKEGAGNQRAARAKLYDMKTADSAWAGIQKEFLETKDGGLNLNKTISVAGLGGNPYRDGTYNYYVGEKVVTNDPKGVGAALLASVEMDNASDVSVGRGKTVLLDNYFNHELRKDDNGREVTCSTVSAFFVGCFCGGRTVRRA